VDECVIDASAALALLRREAGWEAVARLESRVISTVNLAEVGSYLMNDGYAHSEMAFVVSGLEARLEAFDREHAFEAARLRPLTKSAGLSLGDRACLALARLRALPVMTADRAWAHLDLGIRVMLIR
jgi:PIN domain nuclease of toxin-antitoxin system